MLNNQSAVVRAQSNISYVNDVIFVRTGDTTETYSLKWYSVNEHNEILLRSEKLED